MKFPKTIYVKIEKDNNETFLATYFAPEDCDEDGITLGIYELVDKGTLRIHHNLLADNKAKKK